MKHIVEYRNSDDVLIYKFDRKTKLGEYFVTTDRPSNTIVNPIKFEGFVHLPSGFYKEGFGLTSGGNLAVQELYKLYNKSVSIKIVLSGSSHLDTRGKSIKLTLLHSELSKLNETARTIKRENNEKMRVAVQHFLGGTFIQLKELKDTGAGYIPGHLAELLHQDKLFKNLSSEDRAALEEFIPGYLANIPGTLKAKKKLQVIFDALDAGKRIFLEKVIAEFRKRLDGNSQNESIWQKFLSEYILVIRHNYGEVLEKESVSLQGKFPDFMLVDPYGYLDIYEIKKPSTELLKYDRGRNNYYWDAELSKAIAQVENYSYQAQRHADSLSNDIRKAKGIEVNIVKPRGYIIAGRRSQLISDKMADDFRILCDSLKNVDIILYDDLLDSLETFADRIKGSDATNPNK